MRVSRRSHLRLSLACPFLFGSVLALGFVQAVDEDARDVLESSAGPSAPLDGEPGRPAPEDSEDGNGAGASSPGFDGAEIRALGGRGLESHGGTVSPRTGHAGRIPLRGESPPLLLSATRWAEDGVAGRSTESGLQPAHPPRAPPAS